ncbi:MAG: hypothetical protein FWF38_00885, partial [Spirochaetaceae bacterium]|nr:hypothetical protein [Spirochaetaceae bacterium]
MKPIKLSIYILLSVVLLFTLTCDIYDKSVPEYLDKYTNTATVADHSFTGGMLINQQGVPYQNLIEKDSSVITLKLRNPKNYEIVTNLEYHNGSDWIPFIRDEAPGDYSTVENTSAYFTGTTITVKYEPTTQIRITITDAEIGQSYKLRVRLYDRETKREFEPYVLPSIKCTGYPKAVGFMMVRAGTGNNGVVVDWQQLLRSGTTTGDLADANRLVISCSDLGVSQTYTRALNEVTSIWGPWSPAGINEASNPFFSITLGAGTLDEGRSYNVVLRFSNEAGVVTEISESLTAATMDARIVRGGGLQTDEYPSLQEAFNSMDTHGETSATITVLRSIMDQAPVTISGNKTINLESSGTNMIQLGAAHAGSALLTVHNGLTLKIGGALTLRGIDPNTTALISINSGGTLTLDAGAIITGNKTNSATGGGVYIGGGTLNMLAGSSINGNAASTGGGVYIGGVGSIFTMSGGEITGNTSTSNGGGVYFASGTFNMSNGSIEGNTATTSGGGVNVNGAGSTFTMSGGNINGNTALDGGGVRLGVGNFNMSSGTITGNGGSNGGGVSVAGGTFAFSGGTIGGTTTQTRNTATTSGGGVYISGGTFNFSNGTITGNTASQYGGGVYLGGTSSVTMSGGSVESNSATINGGGVHLAAGTFTMSGGVVYGSDATPSSLANTSNGNGKSLNVAGGSAVYAAPYGTGNILSGGTGSYAYTLPMYEAVVTINGTDTPFETLADAFGSVTSGPAPAALITLRKNVTNFRTDVTGNKTITLVSEGDKQIELGTASGSMFVVYSGSTLILGGTTPGELTLVGKATSTAALVTVDNGGTLTVNEDTIISGNTNSGGSGGGVNSSGTFILSGGNITGNTAGDGGGVFIGAGIFIMTSGTIENNNSTYNGGGVYVTNMGEEFNMSNGVIRGNKGTGASSVGGGVYFAGQSFRMSNGQIGGTSSSNQNSARNGGGVYIAGGNQAIFTFSGGTIGGEGSNCNQAIGSTGMGGGVYIAGGTFDIPTGSSAIIKGNTADSSATGGGGVYVGANATFNMRSGQIGGTSGTSANSATLGGGVYVAGTGVTNAGTFNLYGGTIGGNGSASNTTGAGGGGVAIGAFGFFNIPTGSATAEIKGNTSAGTGGGGVLVLDSGVFTMRAGTIKENNSTATGGVNGGGGVQVYYGTFTMEGGRIEANNAARSGGGVFVYGNSAIFAISGGYVYGNDGAGYSPTGVPNVRGASGSGASICIESSGTARYEGAYGGDVIYTTDATLPETPMVRLTIAGVHTEYIRLAAAFAAIPDGSTATVTLLDNITSQMPIPAITGTDRTITLTNEGGPRTINLTSSGSLLTADAGTKLIIEGSSPVNTITLKGMAGNNNSLIRVLNGGELVLNTNAILSGNTQNSAGGGVYVSGATSKFTMNSGIIENNQGSSGGGVYLISGTFEMNGGIIQGNLVGSTGYGGGVYITTGGNFIMNNGTITNNSVNLSTNRGGGVHLDNA